MGYDSMVTLFMAITGGDDWSNLAGSLRETGEGYYFIFLVFVCVLFFAVLNIVTGIFLQNAEKASQHDLANVARENDKRQKLDQRHLKQLFQEMDKNNSGSINAAEFAEALENKAVHNYFKMLHIDVADAHGFFMTLVHLSSEKEVDVDTFVDSCTKLKGDAKRADVQILTWRMKQMHLSSLEFMHFVEQELASLKDTIQGVREK